jgi:alpha-beta hydrolase superfamily lysophospholipase
MKIFWLFLLCLASLSAEVLEQADGTPLHYYFDAPSRPGPLVVILQGSECRRVSDKYGPLIARLNQADIGVLRVEKPGLTAEIELGECPLTYLQRNTLERRLWDLLSVLGEMRKRQEWNGKLALVGGSEGAMLAAVAAPLIPETRAVTLISGGGGDSFAEEIADVMRAQGAGEKPIAEFRELCQQVHQEPSPLKEWGSDGKLARNTHLWLSRAEDLALWRPLLRVSCPILVVHGGADRSTPVESARRLAQIFQEHGKSNLELRIESSDGHDPSTTSLEKTLNWVIQQLGR